MPLPMYANAWLGPQPGHRRRATTRVAGRSERVLDLWQAAAPALDLIGPGVYVARREGRARRLRPGRHPLFVPEAQFRTGSLFWALGHHAALGFSVFGVTTRPAASWAGRAR